MRAKYVLNEFERKDDNLQKEIGVGNEEERIKHLYDLVSQYDKVEEVTAYLKKHKKLVIMSMHIYLACGHFNVNMLSDLLDRLKEQGGSFNKKQAIDIVEQSYYDVIELDINDIDFTIEEKDRSIELLKEYFPEN